MYLIHIYSRMDKHVWNGLEGLLLGCDGPGEQKLWVGILCDLTVKVLLASSLPVRQLECFV